MIGMKSHKPNSGQYLDENCNCVSSQHCDDTWVSKRFHAICLGKRAYLPEQIITEPLDSTRTHENVKRRTVYGRCHEMGFNFRHRNFAGNHTRVKEHMISGRTKVVELGILRTMMDHSSRVQRGLLPAPLSPCRQMMHRVCTH